MKYTFLLSILLMTLIVSCAPLDHTESQSTESFNSNFHGLYPIISSEDYRQNFQGEMSIADMKKAVEEERFMSPARIRGVLTAIGSLRGRIYMKRAIIQDWSGGVILQTANEMNLSLTDIGKVIEVTVTEARQRYRRVEVTGISNFVAREAQSRKGESSSVYVNDWSGGESDGVLTRWRGRVSAIQGDAIVTLSVWGCPDVRIERSRVQGRGLSIGTKIDVIAPLTRFYDRLQADFVSFFPGSLENHLRIEGLQ